MEKIIIPGIKDPVPIYKNLLLITVDKSLPLIDGSVQMKSFVIGDWKQLSIILAHTASQHKEVAQMVEIAYEFLQKNEVLIPLPGNIGNDKNESSVFRS